MDSLRILVCGGRNFNDQQLLNETLYRISEDRTRWPFEGPTIISGMAKGADQLAAQWAKDNWLPLLEFPANWKEHGRAAGPIRNQQMLVEGKPDLVVAFPGGNGTAHMVKIAREAGVEVIEFK